MPKQELFIVKIGGNILDNDLALEQFLQHFSTIKGLKILIHGGGKIATEIGKQLNIVSTYHEGRRITDAATLDLVTMVYAGLINKKIVAKLQSLSCNALGLTGADGNSIPATQRNSQPIDFGFVGDVLAEHINTNFLDQLFSQDICPIFSPLTHNQKGVLLNTNADTIAATLGIALSKNYTVRLIYCFEKKGILENIADDNSVIPLLTPTTYEELLKEKKLFEGILPKLENAFSAIHQGVNEVLIGHAKDIIANTTSTTIGTIIRRH